MHSANHEVQHRIILLAPILITRSDIERKDAMGKVAGVAERDSMPIVEYVLSPHFFVCADQGRLADAHHEPADLDRHAVKVAGLPQSEPHEGVGTDHRCQATD